MFHDVRDLDETNFPKRYLLRCFLRKTQFEHQINHIVNNYTVISSTELKQIDYNDNKRYAVLTFDDGLQDHYYVHKILKQKGVSGTFFVPTLPITSGKMIPSHKIQFIQSATEEKLLTQEILSCFDNKSEIWNIYSKTKWKDNWWSKEMIFNTNILRKHKTKDFNNYEYIDFLFKKYVNENEFEFSKKLYLSPTQLEEMSNNNMVIGGHGYTSENLLLLTDYENDIDNSYKFVSKYTDKFLFSYPNGGFNDEIKSCLKNKKCEVAFTVNPMTLTELDSIDYLEFPRYNAPQKLTLT